MTASIRFAALLVVLWLTGCGGGGTPPAPVPTPAPVAAPMIPDISSYLAQTRCPDGAAPLGCVGAIAQRAADPMLYRRADWSGHTDGQIEDAFVSDDGSFYVNTFSYPPHAPFVAANGDGGDVIVTDGHTARISFTQNGDGHGGTLAGYWIGAACGGTGWLLFDDQAPTGGWASRLALLAGAADPGACPPLNPAYTQWRAETADVPFIVDGSPQTVMLPIVVSEHYAGLTADKASSMERFVMAKGWGRVLWEAWGKTPAGNVWACPGLATWSDPPGPGWYLQDRRCLTKLVATDGALTGDMFGWPPPGFVPR